MRQSQHLSRNKSQSLSIAQRKSFLAIWAEHQYCVIFRTDTICFTNSVLASEFVEKVLRQNETM